MGRRKQGLGSSQKSFRKVRSYNSRGHNRGIKKLLGPRLTFSLTLEKVVIKLIIELRGASIHQVEHELAIRGYKYQESLGHLINSLANRSFLYKEEHPCKCCWRGTNYYYATDFAKELLA